MTHAWLFTGPPGSGRSVAARAFAAALQCEREDDLGCGQCQGCRTVRAGTHPDVRSVVPAGLSIGVDEMRAVVAASARRPVLGGWQVVVIEDADRLTERPPTRCSRPSRSRRGAPSSCSAPRRRTPMTSR
jgi:DNA polymerase-3 subunit delta'